MAYRAPRPHAKKDARCPDDNAAHHDHLHLDIGRTGLCA
jgi:hypothetical protein